MPEILAEVEESIDITAEVAATPGSLTDDYNDMQNRPSINGVTLEGDKTTNDLHIDHVPLADNLVATTGTTNTTPYTLRSAPSYAGSVAELKKIVGGTLGWNQMIPDSGSTGEHGGFTFTKNGDGSWTITGTGSTNNAFRNINYSSGVNNMHLVAGHVYFLAKGTTAGGVGVNMYNGTAEWYSSEDNDRVFKIGTVNTPTYARLQVIGKNNVDIGTVKVWPNAFDLTALFGSTIADAIYTMETTTAGSGVAFFRSLFPSDYYPYSASTLQSVQTSARQALDGNGNVIRSYPLDSDLTLRGIPQLTNGVLSYDGDIYLPSGQVARRYWEFDLGSVTFYQVTGHDHMFYYALSNSTTDGHARKYGNNASVVAFQVNGYTFWGNNTSANIYAGIGNMQVAGFATTYSIVIRNDSCSTPAELKTALNGVHIVYPLETPTTESADPYTEVQLAGSTEQFVCDNYIPVGNETFYPTDLTGVVQNLAPLPTTAGTYKLQVTVSGGVPSYSWVAG